MPVSGTSRRRSGTKSPVFRISKDSLNLSKSGVGMKKAVSAKSGVPFEFRCIKHTPRVAVTKQKSTMEMYEYESQQWRNAFDKMGTLHRLQLKPPAPFTILNKAPYHCPSLGRTFQVDYGQLSQVEGASVKGVIQKKKDVYPFVCQGIHATQLPTIKERLKVNSLSTRLLNQGDREFFYYLPKSTVCITWDPARHSNRQTICEWILSTFGPYTFTIPKDSNCQIVAFDTMEQAHRAVRFPLSSASRIHIAWFDRKYYNSANLKAAQGYQTATDRIWQKLGAPKIEPRKSVSKKSRTFSVTYSNTA